MKKIPGEDCWDLTFKKMSGLDQYEVYIYDWLVGHVGEYGPDSNGNPIWDFNTNPNYDHYFSLYELTQLVDFIRNLYKEA